MKWNGDNAMRFGALEAGGTKMVCAIGDENGNILDRVSIPTETPDITMPIMLDYFKDKDIKAIGIASFGPIDLHEDSKDYGMITSTPKAPWRNFNIVKSFTDELHIPAGFDTDVNGSLIGEATYGQAKGISDAVYITIGTGVGGGVITNGRTLHGMLHPEIGHIRMVPHPEDEYAATFGKRGGTLEELAAGPSLIKRWGMGGGELPYGHKGWDIEAFYIGQAVSSYILVLSPKLIIIGGGVMHADFLLPMIRKETLYFLDSYIDTSSIHDIDNYIVAPSLNDDQGVMGAVKLAVDAYKKSL